MKNIRRVVVQVSLILLLAGAGTVAQAQSSSFTESALPNQPGGGTTAAAPASHDDGCSLSPFSSLENHSVDEPYTPITACQRLQWFITDTVGPVHLLAGGFFSAGIGTAENHPKAYGPHWEGFADRFGMRLTGISTGNAIEATLGAVWGEDPRYFREPERGFGGRLGNVVKQTFMARHRGGEFDPAYARYIAVVGNNFMSNTWRVKDEADTSHALERVGEGFAGRMAANAWEEFWPSISSHLFHHGQ